MEFTYSLFSCSYWTLAVQTAEFGKSLCFAFYLVCFFFSSENTKEKIDIKQLRMTTINFSYCASCENVGLTYCDFYFTFFHTLSKEKKGEMSVRQFFLSFPKPQKEETIYMNYFAGCIFTSNCSANIVGNGIFFFYLAFVFRVALITISEIFKWIYSDGNLFSRESEFLKKLLLKI